MANKVITEMGLPKSYSQYHDYSTELLDVGLAELTCAVALISKDASPPYNTVQSLLEQLKQNDYLTVHLPMHLKGLDAALSGGITFDALMEFVGSVRIGKT